MSRIAVVGSGIAGLASAWLLSRRHDVLLFEREARLGGHTHTHHLDTPDGPLSLDTGFLVHNDRTYPLLVRLFDELGVARRDADMSFGVTDRRTGFEYSTRNLNGLFAQRRNLVRPGHYALLFEILRFNRLSQGLIHTERRALARHDERRRWRAEARRSVRPDGHPDSTVGEFLDRHRFSGELVDRYLLPLAAAIWSTSVTGIREFPLMTLVTFFHQHGMNTALNHPTWKVVDGGSGSYIPLLLRSPRIAIHAARPPSSIRRTATGVTLAFTDGAAVDVDDVVFACHGDEVLPILTDATPLEREVLSAFTTTPNEAWLHMDASFLPRRPLARAAWNYLLDESSGHATVTYHLNRLQGLQTTREYCVTLNPTSPIAPYDVLARMSYTHPRYTSEAVAAQARWGEISGSRRAHFCGAYWFYGFHEDGLRSAVRVAAALGVDW